ncbi:MAG: leucine-rich repeat domain-containing protein, partial [Anaeroplasmataceae bacterium]|nr:leucine-rich repeat domain-containing protein [Anaeroplasmataceae bacterium]
VLQNEMYSSITEIGERAFYNCSSLEELVLSERLNKIDTEAFRKTGLLTIVIPASVQTYGEYTFAETKNMETADIKSTQNGVFMFFESSIVDVALAIDTAYIAKGAFKNCENLETVTFVTHFIEEVKYKLPYGEVTNEEYDKSLYVSYILLYSVLNGTGLDGQTGTIDDTYTQDGKTYIVGESCTIGGGTEIEVAINAATNEIYKVLGQNLYILLDLDYANNTITEVGPVISAGPSGDIFNEADNISPVLTDADDNYYFVVDNVMHYAGASGMLGSSTDRLYITVGTEKIEVTEIEGIYYSISPLRYTSNVYYKVDNENLTKELVYQNTSGQYIPGVVFKGSSYYINNNDGTFYNLVDGVLSTSNTLVVLPNNVEREVIVTAAGKIFENLEYRNENNELIYGNVYREWIYTNGTYSYTDYSAGPSKNIENEEDNKVAIYLSSSDMYVLSVEGYSGLYLEAPNGYLGTEDDIYYLATREISFIYDTASEVWYHDNVDNTWTILTIYTDDKDYTVKTVCLGPDRDLSIDADGNITDFDDQGYKKDDSGHDIILIVGGDGLHYLYDKKDGIYYSAKAGLLSNATSASVSSISIVGSATSDIINCSNPNNYFNLVRFNGAYFVDYGDNSYRTINYTGSGEYREPNLGPDRFIGGPNGELTQDAIDNKVLATVAPNGLVYIDNGDGTYTLSNGSGKFNFNGSKGVTHIYYPKNEINTTNVVVNHGTKANIVFESLSHNVYNEWTISGTSGSYSYTSRWICAGKDLSLETADDIVEIVFEDGVYRWYEVLTGGTRAYHGYGLDGLLGTKDDSSFIEINGNTIEVVKINNEIYHVNADNTYSKYTAIDESSATYNETLICLGADKKFGTSDDVPAVYGEDGLRYIDLGDDSFQNAGADGLLGTADDVLCHVGADNKIGSSDDIIDVIKAEDNEFYKFQADNVYSWIVLGVESQYVSAGKDTTIGTSDDIKAGSLSGNVVSVVFENNEYYIEMKYNNYFKCGADGLLGTADDVLFYATSLTDTATYKEVMAGPDGKYYTADDYIMVDAKQARFAGVDFLVNLTSDLLAYVGGDKLPYSYHSALNYYESYELVSNAYQLDGNKWYVPQDKQIGTADAVLLEEVVYSDHSHYYIPLTADSYQTYIYNAGDKLGTANNVIVYKGYDDTLGTFDDYYYKNGQCYFAGADGLIDGNDLAAVCGADKLAYKLTAKDFNTYYRYDYSHNYNTTIDYFEASGINDKLISAGNDEIIGNEDDIDTVFESLSNGEYYYAASGTGVYITSPTHHLGVKLHNKVVYVGKDSSLGTADDYYISSLETFGGTFAGVDKVFGTADDLTATIGVNQLPYKNLGDNTYYLYDLTAYGSGVYATTGVRLCGMEDCRPGDTDDQPVELGANNEPYLLVDDTSSIEYAYRTKSKDGLLGTVDDVIVYTGTNTRLGDKDDYYYIEIDGSSYKAYSGNDAIFFTADDYYIKPKEIIKEMDNALPKEIKSIGEEAFYGCVSLKSFDLYIEDDHSTNETLEFIGDRAFFGCTSLEEIVLPYTLNDKQKDSYGEAIFEGCTSLNKVVFNEVDEYRVPKITKRMFYGCVSLSQIYYNLDGVLGDLNVMPQRIEIIEDEAFMDTRGEHEIDTPTYSTKLKFIFLPEALVTLGDRVFKNSDLESITILDQIENIGEDVFKDCIYLEQVEYQYDDTRDIIIPEGLFDGCIRLSEIFFTNTSLDPMVSTDPCVFADRVVGIEAKAFRDTAVENVVFSDRLSLLGDYAFYNCDNIDTIVIPEAVNPEGYGKYIFAESNNIVSAEFGYGVTTVPEGIFMNCSSLSEVYFYDYEGNKTVVLDSITGMPTDVILGNMVTPVPADKLKYPAGEDPILLPVNYMSSTVNVVGAYAFTGTAIKNMVFTEGLTELGTNAFAKSDLETITITKNVTKIWDGIFAECKNLKEVIFQNNGLGNQMFIDCTGLTSITLPYGVTEIGAYAFQNCENLAEVSVPTSVETIMEGAFANCIKIQDLTLPFIGKARGTTGPEGLFGWIFGKSYIESLDENGEVVSRTQINPVKQYYAGDVTDPTNENYEVYSIPDTLRTIKITDERLVSFGAFMNTSLDRIVLPDVMDDLDMPGEENTEKADYANASQLTSIGDYAFYNCQGLTTAEIPTQILNIGNYAFAYCQQVDTLALPKPIVISELTNEKLKAQLQKELGSQEEAYGLQGLGSYSFYHCESLPTITIPKTVQGNKIGSYVFAHCHDLEELIFENDSLGVKMFSNCYSLKDIVLPEQITRVDSGTFEVCTSLRYVYIPKSVTYIGQAAFDRCPSLVKLVLPFIGSSNAVTNTEKAESVFGWIFGSTPFNYGDDPLTEEKEGTPATAVTQYYSDNGRLTVYIPNTLKEVYITNENIIAYGAFSTTLESSKAATNTLGIEKIVISHDYVPTKVFATEGDPTLQEAIVNNGMYLYHNDTSILGDGTPTEETHTLGE